MSELEAEPLKKSKSIDEAKIDELNKAQGSTYIHLFHRMCTIIGYVVVLVLILSVYMKALSLINLMSVEKYANGLPKIDVWAMVFAFAFFFPFWGLSSAFINNNLSHLVCKGLKGVMPSLKLHYIKCTALGAIIIAFVFFIFSFAASKGLDQGTADNLQIFFALTVLVCFVSYDWFWILKKTKQQNDNVDEETINQLENKTKGLNILIVFVNAIFGVFLPIFFQGYYVSIFVVLYRLSGPFMRCIIALVIHPIAVELFMTYNRFDWGTHDKGHPYYHHLWVFGIEFLMNLFRRFLFNDANDTNLMLLLVILTGLQEVIIRSCMEWKEVMMRKLMGREPMTEELLVMKRKYYSYAVTSRSIVELTSILIAPVMFSFFFPSRYAIDFGYAGLYSVGYESLLNSTVLQFIIELCVIYACSLIEVRNGIPMSDFFHQFRDFKVLGSHLTALMANCCWILYNFKTIPNKLICSEVDNPCSCPSFSVYQFICTNLTALNSTVTLDIEGSSLSAAFIGNSNVMIVILCVLGMICIFGVTYYLVLKKDMAKYKVQVQQKHQIMIKTVLDATTVNLIEQSAVQQAIAAIESLCRGVSPSQARLLQGVIETLKSQAKVSNVINVEGMFLHSDQDEGTKSWLKEQLMSHEQFQMSSNKNNNRKTTSKNAPLFDKQRRLSIESRGKLTNRSIYAAEPNDNPYSFLKGMNGNDDNLDISSWDFNIFVVESRKPQSWLAWRCFLELQIFEELNIAKLQMSNMLLFVEDNYSLVNYDSYYAYGESFNIEDINKSMYHPANDESNDDVKLKGNTSNESKGNQYHNNLHGADVFQGVLYFVTKYEDIFSNMGEFDLFAVLFAAYIHDFNHPGLNTSYMISDWPSSGISSTFGTESPLEKHHLAMAFNLMRNTDQYNFLINCSPNRLDYFRKVVTDCVMATDLAKSMTWISSSRIVINDKRKEGTSNPMLLSPTNNGDTEIKVKDEKKEIEYKILLMQLSIKCADVGHPARPLEQHIEWSSRICAEFYSQGDKERAKGMKISPLCDRNVSISTYPQSQIGFINYVCKPCFTLLNEVVSLSTESEDDKPWLKYMKLNIDYWEEKKKAHI